MDLTCELVDMARAAGASLAGTAPVERFNGAPRGHHPREVLPGARSVFTFGIRILFGPDQRTRITADTRQVIFAVFAPPGIGEPAVRHHLQDIQANVLLIAPNARAETLAVHAT